MISWFPEKIAAYESEIRFDPNILDLGDLAISHAIVSVNKLFKLFFYTINYDKLCVYSWQNKILLMNMDMQQFKNLNKTKTIALSTL
jgi:hypothetical protein